MNQAESQKILFVINLREYFRNYVTSGVLKEIIKDCTFLTNEKVGLEIPKVPKNKIINYLYPPRKTKLHWHFFNINTKKFIHRSKTFKFRFLRLPRNLQYIYNILSLPLIYSFVKLVIRLVTYDKKLESIIDRERPGVILIPSSGYEGISFEIIKYAKKIGIPTCLLIDNWDNLCSKTVFTEIPDYICVWSEQSKEHAMKIHGIRSDQIIVIGSARFISYFNQPVKNPASPYNFIYALFAGNALAFDELTTLKELDRIIDKNKSSLKIIYRPHPWRQPRQGLDTFFEYDFKNILLDDEAKMYYKKDLGDNYAPPLNYYPKLLSNMEFMICPLSTMLIEGLIFKKRVYVLTYDDGIHFTNPKNAYRYYEHFTGINKLNGVSIIDQINKLSTIFKNKNEVTSTDQKIDLDYFITSDTKYYPERLKKSVEMILKDYYGKN